LYIADINWLWPIVKGSDKQDVDVESCRRKP